MRKGVRPRPLQKLRAPRPPAGVTWREGEEGCTSAGEATNDGRAATTASIASRGFRANADAVRLGGPRRWEVLTGSGSGLRGSPRPQWLYPDPTGACGPVGRPRRLVGAAGSKAWGCWRVCCGLRTKSDPRRAPAGVTRALRTPAGRPFAYQRSTHRLLEPRSPRPERSRLAGDNRLDQLLRTSTSRKS